MRLGRKDGRMGGRKDGKERRKTGESDPSLKYRHTLTIPFCVLGLAPRFSNSSTIRSSPWSQAYIRAVQPDLSAVLGSNPGTREASKHDLGSDW